VRSSLLWAASNGVSLAIRSGGHSYAGYSTTSGLLVDVSLMNEVAIHGAEELVRMRDRAITHGRCMGVGVAGLALGGGIGFSQRWHGLTCDQLIETEIVTTAGEWLSATKTRTQICSGHVAAEAEAISASMSRSPSRASPSDDGVQTRLERPS